MNKIIEVAKNAKEIMSSPPITCSCGEKWYSPFDKLYFAAYGKCTSCSSVDEALENSENIFAIIEAA